MHATPSVFLMTSFLFVSFSETPSILHSILISVLSSNPSPLLVTVQVSAPYITTEYDSILKPETTGNGFRALVSQMALVKWSWSRCLGQMVLVQMSWSNGL